MSFIDQARPEQRRRITDARALRALAHPLRLALLDRLISFGEQTAAQCAEAVGSTPSNCSYHLRALARAGLVEAGESADGRERPWRSASTGFEFGPDDPPPGSSSAAAARTIDELALSRDEELTRRALARHHEQPAEWRAVEARNSYALNVAPSELASLVHEIDRLVRPYIGLTRGAAPDDADVVYLRLLAFRHPQSA
ncbi:MAG TPA: helix-turn-helix domain-containing protein [Solirubrobacteraceae bacterium]|jgi:DNA-binding transcriptional ArsR family regulator|nr:helix-turn-helix domain-containing protein [Solirubrobacteraceae bacterium]